MTWKELERLAVKNGWKLLRHGKRHDIYCKDGIPLEIERHWHQEVKTGLLIKLLRQINDE
ncbi:MAG: type II toxin-antitoxin system HicA family toxin [Bacteroidales bacterium]|nr:type II toxin-antitoxin system HicA family toxin [Bacteroidales bacterium]